MIVKIECEREDPSFIAVAPTLLFFFPTYVRIKQAHRQGFDDGFEIKAVAP